MLSLATGRSLSVPVEAILVVPIAFGLGWAVGTMPCWQTWQGYVALLVVAPVAIATGVHRLEVIVDCLGLAAGFAFGRR